LAPKDIHFRIGFPAFWITDPLLERPRTTAVPPWFTMSPSDLP
jgi:hypothetical protein